MMLSHPIQKQGMSLYLFKSMCVSFSFKKFSLYRLCTLLVAKFISKYFKFFVANTNGVSPWLYLLIIVFVRECFIFLTLYPLTLLNYPTVCFYHCLSLILLGFLCILLYINLQIEIVLLFHFFTSVFSCLIALAYTYTVKQC